MEWKRTCYHLEKTFWWWPERDAAAGCRSRDKSPVRGAAGSHRNPDAGARAADWPAALRSCRYPPRPAGSSSITSTSQSLFINIIPTTGWLFLTLCHWYQLSVFVGGRAEGGGGGERNRRMLIWLISRDVSTELKTGAEMKMDRRFGVSAGVQLGVLLWLYLKVPPTSFRRKCDLIDRSDQSRDDPLTSLDSSLSTWSMVFDTHTHTHTHTHKSISLLTVSYKILRDSLGNSSN